LLKTLSYLDFFAKLCCNFLIAQYNKYLKFSLTDKKDLKAGMEESIRDLVATVEIMQTFPGMAGKSLHEVVAELQL
jgi:hypothetical protein